MNPPTHRPRTFRIAAVLVALAFISYAPVFRAGFVWDDVSLTDNSLITEWSGLPAIWFHPSENPGEEHYWPIVYSSFWLEHKLWGLAPLGYHITNVLLHAANC